MNPLIYVAVGIAAVLGFGPKMHWPTFGQKQPPTQQLVVAQDELARAKAAQATAEAALADARAKEASRTKAQIQYAQQTNEGVVSALSRVPEEHRTAETKLAGDLAGRTSVSLAAAVGELPPELRAEILKIVDGALSKVEAERDAAQAALRAKDAELQTTIQEKAALARKLPELETSLATTRAEVQVKDATAQTLTNQVRVYAEQTAAETKKANSLDAFAGSLVRWAIVAGVLYVVAHWLLPSLAQEFPGVGWLAAANKTVKSITSAHV